MWQDTSTSYTSNPYYGQPQAGGSSQGGAQPLQFYTPSPGPSDSTFFPGQRSSLDGSMHPHGSMGTHGASGAGGFGGNIQALPGPWWTAFGTGGFEGEPPLLNVELGVNFAHIRAKTFTVLNPLRQVDEHIMDDADLAGPLIFCFCFASFLLFSGKPQFGYIYGVALLGSASIYTLLNLMSEKGIDAYRVASVLGYCLLPMVGVGGLSIGIKLDGFVGSVLSVLSILWCTYSASGIFVAVLRMSDQRLLVAYPVGLLYGCFALLSVFNVGGAPGTPR
ncbi:Yip1-domain-containing protein [Rickenella mellea]|uniref:Protein YIP n=1 Tax=Rickenella mellea TaxID=50990 RepID=A0A4Y7Q9P2_9AGAM|nr:Yip1-domain-containing protein [Rickenella mellea]